MSVELELALAEAVIGLAGAAFRIAGIATVLTATAIYNMVQNKGEEMLLTEKDIKETNIKPSKPVARPVKQYVKEDVKTQVTYQTKFVDKDLIIQALKKAKINYTESNRQITCNIPNNEIKIVKSIGGNYELKISGDCNINKIQSFYNKVGKEYENIVQQKICNDIKSKIAKSSSMSLDQEEVLEDKSVLLTISI